MPIFGPWERPIQVVKGLKKVAQKWKPTFFRKKEKKTLRPYGIQPKKNEKMRSLESKCAPFQVANGHLFWSHNFGHIFKNHVFRQFFEFQRPNRRKKTRHIVRLCSRCTTQNHIFGYHAILQQLPVTRPETGKIRVEPHSFRAFLAAF